VLAVTATIAQRAITSQLGQPPSNPETFARSSSTAATIRIGAQTPAMNTCIESALPCPALARLAIINRAKNIAETSGSNADHPSSKRLGLRIIATPTRAIADTIHTMGRTFSPKSGPLNAWVKTGARNPMAIASAKGIT